jgi:1-acyl-sn-glycerol-3-phosphate acyltransferase
MADDGILSEDTLDANVINVSSEQPKHEVGESGPGAPAPVEGSLDGSEIPDEAERQELAAELDRLIARIKAIQPDYNPPPFSPQRMISMVSENIGRLSPDVSLGILEKLRTGITKDVFDLDTWKGLWFMLNYTVDYQKDLLKRRVAGEYETDEWGYDQEVVDTLRPFFEFLYKTYWRVETSGVENIPAEGRALLVANHSGQLPFDGTMLGIAVLTEHPEARYVRTLYASWFATLPVLSSLFVKVGQALANEDNGIRLLEQEQLVAVFPEGVKGVGKLYKERYQLARFGRGGFVRMAIKTGAPMIPVSIVGAEETYISLYKSEAIARLIGFPFFPITITWPWLGPLGFIPNPTKWYIDIGEPIPTDHYGARAADNMLLVSQLTDQMRSTIQNMLYDRLAQRKSVLFG